MSSSGGIRNNEPTTLRGLPLPTATGCGTAKTERELLKKLKQMVYATCNKILHAISCRDTM